MKIPRRSFLSMLGIGVAAPAIADVPAIEYLRATTVTGKSIDICREDLGLCDVILEDGPRFLAYVTRFKSEEFEIHPWIDKSDAERDGQQRQRQEHTALAAKGVDVSSIRRR